MHIVVNGPYFEITGTQKGVGNYFQVRFFITEVYTKVVIVKSLIPLLRKGGSQPPLILKLKIKD